MDAEEGGVKINDKKKVRKRALQVRKHERTRSSCIRSEVGQ